MHRIFSQSCGVYKYKFRDFSITQTCVFNSLTTCFGPDGPSSGDKRENIQMMTEFYKVSIVVL
jgi:hypothetical protein